MLPKFLRFKGLLVSEDSGKTWLIVRQFYLTDGQNHFIDDLIQGQRFKLIGDSDDDPKDCRSTRT